MSSPEKKAGESICNYIFTRVGSLLSEVSLPRNAFTAFVLHCSFYVLVANLVEANGFYRYFEGQIFKETQAFRDPKRLQKLWNDALSAMSPMYALLVSDYSDICGISEYLKHAALFSFDHFDESLWEERYEQPFLNAGADVIDFVLDTLEQYKQESLSQEKPRNSRIPYIIAIIAVVVAVVAIIIAVSASYSVSNAPSAAAASSAAATEPVSSPAPAEPEPAPEPQPEKLSLPRNGRHYPTYDFSGDAQSSICVHAPSTSNCFVIIKRSSTGKILDRFFVRSGSTVDTYCPKGTLDIYFTFGGDWYGTDFLFGEDTRCQVDREIEFTETIAYEYTLNPVTDGNLHMSEVSIDEALSD